jgi:Protein of unknown function (DUF1194)
MTALKYFAAALAGVWLALAGPAAAQPLRSYDLVLVLAVDCSGSVSGGEYALQIGGIAAAFRDPEVIAAALGGPNGRISVNLMAWGDPDYQKFASGWFEIGTPEEAEIFAQAADRFDYRTGGGTGLGIAVAYAIALIENNGFVTLRKVIDVSGDGVESYEIRPPKFLLKDAHRLRMKAGIVINGLAIMTDDPELAGYYREHVAGGSGSFVMEVDTYSDFAESIKQKLLREIRPATASLE